MAVRKTKTKRKARHVNGSMAPAQVERIRRKNDTAITLLREIQQGRLDPSDLSKTQRQACLVVMANGSQTSSELAGLFKVASSTIREDLRQIRQQLGREVREWTLDEVIGDLAMAQERYAAHAVKQEDPGLAWKIKLEFAEQLRKLGLLQSPTQEGVRVTIESIGEGYERMRAMLSQTLDPRLSGEVIDVESDVITPHRPLGMERRSALPPDHDTEVELVLDPSESEDEDQ